jgi:hypothetical protein
MTPDDELPVDDWQWKQPTDGVLKPYLLDPESPVTVDYVLQGDDQGWPRIVEIRMTVIPTTVPRDGRRAGDIRWGPGHRETVDPLPGIDEDQAVELVRRVYRIARDVDLTQRVLALIRDPDDWTLMDDDGKGQLAPRLRGLDDDTFAAIYRLLVERGHHDPARRMAAMLHMAHGTVRNRIARLRKDGTLRPATGTRAGEAPTRRRTAPRKGTTR